MAEQSEDFTDGIAERAVELGGAALGTIQILSKASRLPAYPLDKHVKGVEYVARLLRLRKA